jgi:hypothetical protein
MSDGRVREDPKNSVILELYKTTLDHREKIISIIFVSGIAVAIPAMVDAYKARMEYLSKETSLELQKESFNMESNLKEKEQNLKELTFRQESIQSFSSTGLQQDIELRIRLAEYFAALAADDVYKEKWRIYLKNLSDRRNESKRKLDQVNDEIDTEVFKQVPDQLHLRKLYRARGWLEAEFNPVVVNEPVTLQPTAVASITNAGLTTIQSSKLLELFGSPVADVNSLRPGCSSVTNPLLLKQLQTEQTSIGRVTLLAPAIQSLKQVISNIGTMSSALAADMKTAGGLCVRKLAVGSGLSRHSFGLAVDIPLGGSFELADNQKTNMQVIAGEFHRQGWIWGGAWSPEVDYFHFEVSQELLQRWINSGELEVNATSALASDTPDEADETTSHDGP